VPFYSDYIPDLFDVINGPGGAGYILAPGPLELGGKPAGGTVSGSIGNNPGVIISPISIPDWAPSDPNDGNVGDIYTGIALHETIHLAASRGVYGDLKLADSVFKLGGLSDAEILAYNKIDRNDPFSSSEFWNSILTKHCH
jgi:hypothetical protein